MSSEASSDQSCVRDGVGYDEVYSSGQDDLGTSYDEQVPSSNSSSAKGDEDVDVDESEGDSNNEDIVCKDSELIVKKIKVIVIVG